MTQLLEAELHVTCHNSCDHGLGGTDKWAEGCGVVGMVGRHFCPIVTLTDWLPNPLCHESGLQKALELTCTNSHEHANRNKTNTQSLNPHVNAQETTKSDENTYNYCKMSVSKQACHTVWTYATTCSSIFDGAANNHTTWHMLLTAGCKDSKKRRNVMSAFCSRYDVHITHKNTGQSQVSVQTLVKRLLLCTPTSLLSTTEKSQPRENRLTQGLLYLHTSLTWFVSVAIYLSHPWSYFVI